METFRVFNIETKKWVEKTLISSDGKVYKRSGYNSEVRRYPHDKSLIIQHYIGKHDVNSLPLYAGDITLTGAGVVGVIIYHDAKYKLRTADGVVIPNWKDLKKIGNMFDNGAEYKEVLPYVF